MESALTSRVVTKTEQNGRTLRCPLKQKATLEAADQQLPGTNCPGLLGLRQFKREHANSGFRNGHRSPGKVGLCARNAGFHPFAKEPEWIRVRPIPRQKSPPVGTRGRPRRGSADDRRSFLPGREVTRFAKGGAGSEQVKKRIQLPPDNNQCSRRSA